MTGSIAQRPRLALAALGGTLSMAAQAEAQGIVPRYGASDLARQLPALAELADVEACTLCLLPSASLGFGQLMAVLEWARLEVAKGAAGVVISQGTDTLEETAYLLGLLWGEAVPLVVTGAMRGADDPAADGPGNVLDAARVAIDPASRGRGVLVVMGRYIHCPARVRKVNTLALNAFASPGGRPLGVVEEGRVRYRGPAPKRQTALAVKRFDPRVALLEATLASGPELLDYIREAGYDGLVVAGFGAGHVPASWVPALERAGQRMPVIIASRTGAGSTAFNTYGFAGGEVDLQRRGLHMAGPLCPRKCRLLLWALIGAGALDQLEQRLTGAGRGAGG